MKKIKAILLASIFKVCVAVALVPFMFFALSVAIFAEKEKREKFEKGLESILNALENRVKEEEEK